MSRRVSEDDVRIPRTPQRRPRPLVPAGDTAEASSPSHESASGGAASLSSRNLFAGTYRCADNFSSSSPFLPFRPRFSASDLLADVSSHPVSPALIRAGKRTEVLNVEGKCADRSLPPLSGPSVLLCQLRDSACILYVHKLRYIMCIYNFFFLEDRFRDTSTVSRTCRLFALDVLFINFVLTLDLVQLGNAI